MNRFLIAVAVIGAVIAYNGTQELDLAEGATAEPLRVSLGDIEAGRIPVNPHLQIGEHWAMNHELVYSYQTDRDAVDVEPGPAQKLDFAYYPIVAADNAYFRELGNLEELYQGLENIPEDRLPELDGFKMLVRTKRYATIGGLPEPVWTPSEGVTGLIANRVRSLSKDEAALIRASFPTIDTEGLLILEEGRRPASAAESYAQIGGGALVAVSPLAFLVMRSRRKSNDEPESDTDANATLGERPEGSTGPGPIA